MGEARRRRQSDPNYGRVPKTPSYRGLVICPPIVVEGESVLIKSTNLDPQELRFALLFWDRLVWPSSRAIHIPSGPDEQFLETAGVLSRPDYTCSGKVADIIPKTQIQAFQDLESKEPGVWAMAQGEGSLVWKEGFAEEGNGTTLELHRAIPIPHHDVPLAEILEFKLRRRTELITLRHHIESFVAEIQSSPDRSAALDRRLKEIDTACADLLLLGKQWQFPVYLSNLKASFSLNPLTFLPFVEGTWKLAEPYGLTAAAAAAAAAGGISTLRVNADYGFRSPKRPQSPYRYAYHIDRELR